VDCVMWLQSVQFEWGVYSVGLIGLATFCTVCVRVSGVWTLWCGYGLYSLCGKYLVCGLFCVATFCTVCMRVSGVWNVVVATACTICMGSASLVD
jgi:hypothetical protein